MSAKHQGHSTQASFTDFSSPLASICCPLRFSWHTISMRFLWLEVELLLLWFQLATETLHLAFPVQSVACHLHVSSRRRMILMEIEACVQLKRYIIPENKGFLSRLNRERCGWLHGCISLVLVLQWKWKANQWKNTHIQLVLETEPWENLDFTVHFISQPFCFLWST